MAKRCHRQEHPNPIEQLAHAPFSRDQLAKLNAPRACRGAASIAGYKAHSVPKTCRVSTNTGQVRKPDLSGAACVLHVEYLVKNFFSQVANNPSVRNCDRRAIAAFRALKEAEVSPDRATRG